VRLEVVALALLLASCISTPTAYTRDAPAAVYPSGELSGESTYFLGWRFRL